ncbi:hypothetical protein, partial [Thermoleptolyngbya sp.]
LLKKGFREGLISIRTYALAMSFLDFGRFLAGAAREKSFNCVSPINSGFWIGGFGLLIPEFAGPPAIGSVVLFPRIDITHHPARL